MRHLVSMSSTARFRATKMPAWSEPWSFGDVSTTVDRGPAIVLPTFINHFRACEAGAGEQ